MIIRTYSYILFVSYYKLLQHHRESKTVLGMYFGSLQSTGTGIRMFIANETS